MTTVTVAVSAEHPAALVSFPQGIPWHLEDMSVSLLKRKRKRIVAGSLNDIEYVGCNFGESSLRLDSSRFAIALLDEKSEYFTLIVVVVLHDEHSL